ncbi:putative membrane protein [Plasticicumulans lactativorans]|uniref:Protoporphyrinogen IX oxidase n=1 Tax=Plasticicumulans lactativorans TaxID=1133106 RepID=A0A4R2KWE9_9GAMM|nr:CopD family protein [Plasticicumulans lactativorans]TCO75579.1 putative membrane protein [Plasticicumulans lactativorans]
MSYLAIKAWHLIWMVTWFAGLFYLPRLYVYHAMTEPDDRIGRERFKVMERKLFWGITTPGGVLTLAFGAWLLAAGGWAAYAKMGWLHAKLLLVALLVVYHVWCGKLLLDFKHERNRRSHVWFRWFNEAPVIVLIAVILLASLKPF